MKMTHSPKARNIFLAAAFSTSLAYAAHTSAETSFIMSTVGL